MRDSQTLDDGLVPAPRASGRPAEDNGNFVRRHSRALFASGVFLAFAVFYGLCLYPGVGGVVNPGDSAKFQTLAYAPIMVHGPGYPLYLMLSAVLRALELPLPGWWQMSFLLSALPAALASALAFLIVERVVGSIGFGVAAALLLGTTNLMALQATETEVYALNIAFVLAAVYFLVRFMETDRLSDFLVACAIYAISFGNHVTMIMLLPLFIGVAALRYRLVLKPRPVLIVSLFVLLGASQYLYLAWVAYNPETAWSEYMPLPPTPMELVNYIAGIWFGDLYGSGLGSPRTLEALVTTFLRAHPWISVPLIAAGLIAFLSGIRRWRETSWRSVAVVYVAALCFLPFVLWYGAWDIESFHLPILSLSLLGAIASLGWWTRRRPVLLGGCAVALIAVGLFRAADVGIELAEREPAFAQVVPQIREVVEQVSGQTDRPVIAMSYELRMASMYHYFAGDLPRGVDYRLAWKLPDDPPSGSDLIGAAIPGHEAVWLTRGLKKRNPDMACEVRKLVLSRQFKWPAFGFRCAIDDGGSASRPPRGVGS